MRTSSLDAVLHAWFRERASELSNRDAAAIGRTIAAVRADARAPVCRTIGGSCSSCGGSLVTVHCDDYRGSAPIPERGPLDEYVSFCSDGHMQPFDDESMS